MWVSEGATKGLVVSTSWALSTFSSGKASCRPRRFPEDHLDPLNVVKNPFRNSVLFAFQAGLAVGIRAPQAEAIPMCLSRDCSWPCQCGWIFIDKVLPNVRRGPSERPPPRHDGKVVTFRTYEPPQAFCSVSIRVIHLSNMASSEFPPPCVSCICFLHR